MNRRNITLIVLSSVITAITTYLIIYTTKNNVTPLVETPKQYEAVATEWSSNPKEYWLPSTPEERELELSNQVGTIPTTTEMASTSSPQPVSTPSPVTPNIFTPIAEIVSEYPTGGMAIPAWSQGDKRWGQLKYNSATIQASGCGPTSCSMVVTALTHKIVYPNELATMFEDFYIKGSGSDHDLFSAVASFYGLTCVEIEHTEEKAREALISAHPIVARVQGGKLSGGGGHYLVLRGINNEGKCYMNDPGNRNNTNMLWDFDYIMQYSTTFYEFY